MVPLKNSIMMICIIMNIVHAGFNEDLENCIGQLLHAFEYTNDSASSCIRHSIKFYIKGQRIPVPAYTLIDENLNITSGRQNDSKMNVDPEDVFDKWLAEELKRYKSPEFGDDNKGQQDVESSSHYGFGIENPKLYSISRNSSQYGFSNSQYGIGNSENDFSNSQYGIGSSENDSSSSYFGFDSKEDFDNYLDSMSWIVNEGQQNIEGSSQTVPGSSQTVPGSSQTVPGSSQTVPGSSQTVPAQQDYPLNYAELYHRELENMLTGRRLLNREKFCDKYYKVCNKYNECLEALKPFGDHSRTAVIKAFYDYTLADCERLKSTDPNYIFIHSYISYLSDKCEARSTTKPSEFCQEQMMAKYNLQELPTSK